MHTCVIFAGVVNNARKYEFAFERFIHDIELSGTLRHEYFFSSYHTFSVDSLFSFFQMRFTMHITILYVRLIKILMRLLRFYA